MPQTPGLEIQIVNPHRIQSGDNKRVTSAHLMRTELGLFFRHFLSRGFKLN